MIRFLLLVVVINFLVFGIFRTVFWTVFRETLMNASWDDLLRAFYLGLKFDLRLALLIGLPIGLLAWIRPLDPARTPPAMVAWVSYLGATQSVVLLLYFVDFGHYAYVQGRLNASLVDHLTPVAVSARVAWDSYPVVWGLLGLGILVWGYAWLMSRIARRSLQPGKRPFARWARVAVVAGFALLYALGIYGKWSWYPLRWSEAYFSSNEAVAALALNPVLYLVDTAENRGQAYDVKKVRKHYTELVSLLGVQNPDPDTLEFSRYVTPARKSGGPFNLVIIHLESFAAFKTGAFGNRLPGTPFFDSIASKGILFTNFFVPEVPTARSVFTMLTGIPDVNGTTTASRNPLLVNQHTLVNALQGYEKFYFLGGSATWGNIRGLFTHNIPDLKMFEEGDYDSPQVDGWGVSDVVLLEKAHSVFAKQAAPFFAFIQTAGNHRPYAIPDEHPGFELSQMGEASLRANGFDGLAAYNGLRYLDFSLARFFALAEKAPYFRNTVFVMYGDHGNPSTVQTPWQELYLTGYHVPFLIYAPSLVGGGRRIDFAASLPDCLPTALGILGVPYRNSGLGRDLFDIPPSGPHFSLIGETGLLDDEYYLRNDPGGTRLFRYRSDAAARDVHEQYPEKTAELLRLYEALYEASKYMLHHNPARSHSRPRAQAVPKSRAEG